MEVGKRLREGEEQVAQVRDPTPFSLWRTELGYSQHGGRGIKIFYDRTRPISETGSREGSPQERRKKNSSIWVVQ